MCGQGRQLVQIKGFWIRGIPFNCNGLAFDSIYYGAVGSAAPAEDNTGGCGHVQGEFIVPLCTTAFCRKLAPGGISVAAAVIRDTLKSTV